MKNTLTIFAIIIIIAASSCVSRRYIYSASPPNNPYFSKKGQSQLTGYYSSSNSNNLSAEFADGFDLQGAYAVSDHWAITAGYFSRKEKDVYNYYTYNSSFDSSVVIYKRNLVDLGGGYFFSLNPKNTIIFNAYGGVGFGKFSFDDNGTAGNFAYNRYHSSNITKWFFQPSINFTTGDYFRCAFILKSSLIHYGDIQTSYTVTELSDFSLDKIANKTLYFLEPGLNFQFGIPKYPWVKLDMSISSVSYTAQNTLGVRSGNASIGLSFDLSEIKKQ